MITKSDNRGDLIKKLRTELGLSQVQFGQLLGAHFVTVSKWEHGSARPTPYQVALMDQMTKTVAEKQEQAKEQVQALLLGAGVVAALIFLLTAAKK